jgi:molybdopterin biosynthesis enzyme MoaB
MTIDFEVLCEDCALSEGVIRVREDLAVEVKSDRLVTQRGNSEVEVFPNEIRHLVDALAEAAVRLVRLVLTVGGTYHKHQTSTEILLQLLQEFIRRYSRLFQYTTQSANGQFAV